MKKTITVIIVSLLISFACYSQTKAQKDSIAREQAAIVEYNRFADSLLSKVTMKEFKEYLYKTVTADFYDNGTWGNLWTWYVNTKYSAWVQSKNKKP